MGVVVLVLFQSFLSTPFDPQGVSNVSGVPHVSRVLRPHARLPPPARHGILCVLPGWSKNQESTIVSRMTSSAVVTPS